MNANSFKHATAVLFYDQQARPESLTGISWEKECDYRNYETFNRRAELCHTTIRLRNAFFIQKVILYTPLADRVMLTS